VKERRHYSRKEVSFPVVMLTSEGAIEGEVKDISLGGAFIHCRRPPHPIEETFSLSIEIPESNYILLATAEVERLETYVSNNDSPSYGVCVSFIKIRACPVEEASFPDKIDD